MKDKRVNLVCRQDQLDSWQYKAKSEGRSLSNWITSVCDAACADHLKELEKEDGVRGKYYEQARSQTTWEEYNQAHDEAALKTRIETGVELSPAREKELDAVAAKLGVTKGGEILEKPTAKIVAPKPAPKKKNQACEVLGHIPVVTDQENVLQCSRCGVRWRK